MLNFISRQIMQINGNIFASTLNGSGPALGSLAAQRFHAVLANVKQNPIKPLIVQRSVQLPSKQQQIEADVSGPIV